MNRSAASFFPSGHGADMSASGASFYSRYGKRAFDLAFTIPGVLFLFPCLVVIGLAVRLTSKGPALFRQVRVGRWGRPFELLKFRTMREGAEKGSALTATGDPRITPLGAWLRRTKVDELPQLWNVIRGDMSLVGPRPEVPQFVARYTEHQREVFSGRPGITGPEINVNEEELLARQTDKESFYLNHVLPAKLEHDLAYVSDMRFSSDVNVLWQTFKKLLIRVHQPYKPPAHTLTTSMESPEK
jgi:lipopolysaccharide/colanic/teichoic acid biosynthesis glycosyltransferase